MKGNIKRQAGLVALRSHNWPGNVRELENAIERACILTDTMTLEPMDLGLGVRVTEENEGLQAIDLSGSLSD